MPASNKHTPKPQPLAGTQTEIAGERLMLFPDRAVYWEDESTLFIADAHWGKAAAMRSATIPLPDTEVEADLACLSRLLHATSAQRLVILGDLLHHHTGRNEETFEPIRSWRETHSATDMILVEGNHDRSSGPVPRNWRIETIAEGHSVGPFILQHFPTPSDNGYVLSGHLHPQAKLSGNGGQHVRLPCFWFGHQVGVLPAFGSLCGGATISPTKNDGVYVIADDNVICISEGPTMTAETTTS